MNSICSAPYEDNDGEAAVKWDERRVLAREEHECYECYCVIPKGCKHAVYTALYNDAGWLTFRRCPACMLIAEMVATLTGCCPTVGGLDESAWEAGIDPLDVRDDFNA